MSGLMLLLGWTALLQAQGGSAVRPIGAITAIDAAARRITIKTDAGPQMSVQFGEATRFLRVAPGAKDLTGAAAIPASALSVGDRILARGANGGDPNTLVADSIIAMSSADIEKKQAAERTDWEQRGVGGIITALNLASLEITIRAHTAAGTKPVVVALASGAVLRRYAPDSIRFSDARLSRFEDLKVGDQVKARGTSSEDHARFTAEELVSGSFRNLAATVVAVDAGRSTLQITDLATSRRLEVRVSPDSTLRRLTPSAAQMLATRVSGGSAPGAGPPQSMIDAQPPLSLADLKPGEAVVVSSTNSGDPSQATAITLLAGVEPLLRASSRGGRGVDIGSWNLDLNMNVNSP
jgi:hypothetical protein